MFSTKSTTAAQAKRGLVKLKSASYLYCLILLFSGAAVSAQTSAINGKVVDSKTGEEIIGANLILDGSNIGTTTDIDGTFELQNVSPGKLKLVCTYIGYDADTTEVEARPGEVLNLTIQLAENVSVLDVVVVSAVRITSTDVAVLNTIRHSPQIVSGLSAESIKRTLDSDAAQVVKRIPGVTVIDNRFIVIRGLNERYNNTMLHNINVPSMEPDVRSFSFDVIPSNVIDQVLIYKSPAPDLPGDFSGGAVKVSTKSIPDETSLILDVSTSYRQGSSMRDFLGETRRNGHWTGLNDGANNLPSDFPERLTSLPSDQIAAAGLSLPNNWKESNYNSGLDYKVALTYNFRKDIGNRGLQLGNVTSLQYSNSKTVFNVINRSFEAFDFTANESKLRFDFQDTEYGQEIMAGVIHNWALRINAHNVIEFKNLYNHLTTHDFIERFGDQVAQGFTQNSFAYFNEYRGLYSGQIIGTHRLKNEVTKLDWIGGYGVSFNDLPDYRRYRRNVVDLETRESVIFVPRGQTPDFLGRFYSRMDERIYSGALNMEHRFSMNKSTTFKPLVKAGVFVESRTRDFEARNLGFSRSPNFDEGLTALPIDQLFAPENIDLENGIRLGENFSPSNFFVATNELLAYYFSIHLPLGNRFNFIGGVRVEDNLQQLRSPDNFQPGTPTPPITPAIIDQTIALPSATLTYELTKNMLLKAVYGKTVNRPEFREIAPFGFYDFVFDATVSGYSFLTNATIDNFDLRWELYPSVNETVSIALFYKNFTNPIESLYGNFGSEQTTFLFRNTESAFARGIELDLRKSFANIVNSNFLSKLSMIANVSIIDSEVTLGEELNELLRAKDRPLQGQSGFIVNTGLFFDDTDRDLQVNLLYNVIGKRILLVGAGSVPDTYEMPRNVLDLSIRKRINQRVVAKFGIKDILNQEFLLLQDGNEDGKLERMNDQVFRQFRPGTSYSLGLTYQLQ
jgi:hypothetical protein